VNVYFCVDKGVNPYSVLQKSHGKSSGLISDNIVSGNETFGYSSGAKIFLGLRFRSHQIFYVHEFAFDRLGINIPINRLGIAFNCPRAAGKRALKNRLIPPKQRGRHTALPEDSEADILAWFQHQAEKSQPSTRTYILHYCSGKFGEAVTRGWMDSFLIRHKDNLAETISKPQGDARLQVPREFLLGALAEWKIRRKAVFATWSLI
jgi:hypothetical protein